MTEPLAVKPKEAARLIGGSRSVVYRLLRKGALRAVKRGTTLLVLMDSIHEHVAALPPAAFSTGRAAMLPVPVPVPQLSASERAAA